MFAKKPCGAFGALRRGPFEQGMHDLPIEIEFSFQLVENGDTSGSEPLRVKLCELYLDRAAVRFDRPAISVRRRLRIVEQQFTHSDADQIHVALDLIETSLGPLARLLDVTDFAIDLFGTVQSGDAGQEEKREQGAPNQSGIREPGSFSKAASHGAGYRPSI